MTDKEKLQILAHFLLKDVTTMGYMELSHMKKADWYDYNFKRGRELIDELDLKSLL